MNACPLPEELVRLVENSLDQADLGAIAVHVESCARCQSILEQLTQGNQAVAVSDSALAKNDEDAALLARLRAKGPSTVLEEQTDDRFSDMGGRPGINGRTPAEPATESSSSTGSFPAITGFRILSEIGRGGMGIVYLAEQVQLNRRIALKVLRSDMFRDRRQVQRFEREVKAAGRLHHTNIVPVFGVGEEDGHPYYVMQCIEGKGLHIVIAELRRREQQHFSPRMAAASTTRDGVDVPINSGGLSSPWAASRSGWHTVARVGLQVAEALEYANRQGVLHRDIKPSNLLVDDSGTVWVTDFGLAKTVDDDDLTSTGDVVGTLRYIAPERLQGRGDATADLYSLGLTLYELVALRPAYPQTDRLELLDKVRLAELPQLRSLVPKIPRDIETIIHKAVDRNPARRYQTAAAMADDLRRFLEGWPIRARRISPAERVVRWCRHNPWATASFAILLLGLLASTLLTYRATRAEQAARTARDRVLAANTTLLHNESDSLVSEEMRPYRKALVTEGLRQAKELVTELQGDPRASPQLVKAYFAMARNQAESGDLPAATVAIDAGLKLARGAADDDPSSIPAQMALADILHQAVLLSSDPAVKRERAKESNAIYLKLLKQNPAASEADHWVAQVAINDHNLGGLCFIESLSANGSAKESLLQNAIDTFLEGKQLCDERNRSGPENEVVLLRLAPLERYLCRAYRYLASLQNEPAAAARAFTSSIEAGTRGVLSFQKLVDRDKNNFQYELELSSAHAELGESYRHAGKMDLAVESLVSGRRSLQNLLAKNGSVVSRVAQVKDLLSTADYNLIEVYGTDPVRYAAPIRQLVNEEFEICEKLDVVRTPSLNSQVVHAFACFAMAEYQEDDNEQVDPGLLLKSARMFDGLTTLQPGDSTFVAMLIIVRQTITDLMIERGEGIETARWRELPAAPVRPEPGLLYAIAVNYAVNASMVGKLPTKQDVRQQKARRERNEYRAIMMLREAVAAGFKDAARIRNEPAFAPLRTRPDFRTILLDLEFPADPFVSK